MTGIFTILALLYIGLGQILPTDNINSEVIQNQIFSKQTLPQTYFSSSYFRNISFEDVVVNYHLSTSGMLQISFIRSQIHLDFARGKMENISIFSSKYENSTIQSFSYTYLDYRTTSKRNNTFFSGLIQLSNFYNVFFDGSTFTNVNFTSSSFSVVSFQNTTFINVTFIDCDFQSVFFDSANLKNVNFRNCTKFQNGIQYIVATFQGTNFENVKVDEKQFPQSQTNVPDQEGNPGKTENPKTLKPSKENTIAQQIYEILQKQGAVKAYQGYLKRFNKGQPENEEEKIFRSKIFQDNLRSIKKVNDDPSLRWVADVNRVSDLSNDEFRSVYLQQLSLPPLPIQEEEDVSYLRDQNIDWRQKGIITSVKDQTQECGSCWAFAATAFNEAYQIKNDKRLSNSLDLSEQQLIDCATHDPFKNYGCQGGWFQKGIEYIITYGQILQKKSQYVARHCCQDSSKRSFQPNVGICCQKRDGPFKIKNPNQLKRVRGCSFLLKNIFNHPIGAAVSANEETWRHYKQGVLQSCGQNLNHAVLVVGYKDRTWILKNSWGKDRGQQGYIRLAEGNTCQICDDFIYVDESD